MDIIGPHQLKNPSFLKAVLETGLLLLRTAKKTSERPFELANKIVEDLKLPSSEVTLVANVIAPRFSPAATIEYMEKAMARLPVAGEKQTANAIEVKPSFAQPLTQSRSEKQKVLKHKILDLLQEKKILAGTYILKVFGADFEEGQFGLIPFSQTFALNEARWQTIGEVFVSLPGAEASKEAMARQLLAENGHKPFPINRLAERYGFSTKQTIDYLKARKFGPLFLWSPYDVWSIADISVSEQRKEKIRKFALSRNNAPILIDDAFDWVVSGVVARNLYSEIFLDSKISAIDKAFAISGVTNYHCNKNQERYVSKEAPEKKTATLEPLYKPLWEDD